MKRTRLASLVLALFLPAWISGCGLLSAKKAEPQRVKLVCAPQALDPCLISRWYIPANISADQTGELALSARAESVACKEKNAALLDCIAKHNEKAQ